MPSKEEKRNKGCALEEKQTLLWTELVASRYLEGDITAPAVRVALLLPVYLMHVNLPFLLLIPCQETANIGEQTPLDDNTA